MGNTLETYKRLLPFAWRYKGRLILGLVFSAVFGGSSVALLVALEKLLEKVFNPATANLRTVLLLAAIFPIIGLIRGLGYYFGSVTVASVGYRVIKDLRDTCFDKLQRLPLSYYARNKAGDLISKVTNDTTIVQSAVSKTLGDFVRSPFEIVAYVGIILWKFGGLAIALLVIIPTCIIPVAILGKRVKRYSRRSQESLSGLVTVLQENITGAREVKAFGATGHETTRFRSESQSVFRRLLKGFRAQMLSQPIMELVTMIGLAAAFIYVYKTKMPVSEFFIFVAAAVLLYTPIRKMGKAWMNLQNAAGAADRVFELLDEPEPVQDAPDARPLDGPVTSITFDNISFAYETDAPAVLRDINLTVRRGECIALVGATGSGKSTLVNLLPRFFDPTAGELRINEAPLRDLTLASIRERIGLVSQETFLFHDTIAANIAYGDPNPDPALVEEAARRANAHEFILEKPEGYDTLVGDRGVQLSGGQRQRLAIARALYRNAPILILDEATSALDTISERQVQSAIDELMHGRTVFAIAHRLSTIRHADRIFVLKDGRIVEQGTHDQLIELNGEYRTVHDLQFAGA